MITFIKDQIIFRNGVEYRIDRALATGIQLENATTGEFSTHDLYSLLTEYTKGALGIAPKKLHPKPRWPVKFPHLWPPQIPPPSDRLAAL